MTPEAGAARWRSSPLVMRRWLGSELARLRNAAGLTQREVANRLGCSVARVSYLESGERTAKASELRDVLLDLYGVASTDRDRYLHAANVASQQGWWDRLGEEDVPRTERRYLGIEDGATRLRAFLPSIVHGLLQTPDYTRGVLRSYKTLPEARIVRLIDLRRIRQELLTREDRPLEAHFLLDEAAVTRQVGSPATMKSQLDHIANISDNLPNVTVQVVPFEAGSHGAYFGPFSILELPWGDDSGVVYVEGLAESRYLEARAEVYEYATLFERLIEMALSPQDSVQFVRGRSARLAG